VIKAETETTAQEVNMGSYRRENMFYEEVSLF
jgi:hypothetical protein